MKPVENERTNFTFKLPGGTEVNDLPVERSEDFNGAVNTSFWLPRDDELIALEDGATITLTTWGSGHPPVALGIGPAPEERVDDLADRNAAAIQRLGDSAEGNGPDDLGINPDARFEFTGRELVTLLTEVGGAVSGVFLREDPTKVMPSEAIVIGLREYIAASQDTFQKAVR